MEIMAIASAVLFTELQVNKKCNVFIILFNVVFVWLNRLRLWVTEQKVRCSGPREVNVITS